MVTFKLNLFPQALPVPRAPLCPLFSRLPSSRGKMLSRAVGNFTKPGAKAQQPLQPKTSGLNAQPVETKKRKFERTMSTASSNLGALHDAVYFDENDFDDDLDFTSAAALPAHSDVQYPSLDRALSEVTYPSLHTERVKQPSSSAPIPWSSSPPEHFKHPAPKRRTVPWLDKDAYTPLAKEKYHKSPYPWNKTASAIKEDQRALRKKNRGKKPVQKDHTGVKVGASTNIRKMPVIFLSDEQKAVLRTVVNDGKSVFFTGSAGTGKSVLMRQIIDKLKDKYASKDNQSAVAVTASTGLAACNIEGSTIHSFAGIGLGKEAAPELIKKVKKNMKAVTRWRQTKVLIMDEISMVDGDLYDKLEGIARAIKNNGRPFGGIQVVVTGDFFQLPPVQESNKAVRFCFDAQTWPTTIQHTILLTHVFRQKDPVFASMLNEMRLGKLTPQSINAFKRLSRPLNFDDDIEATELFPTRKEVETANSTRMRNLSGQVFTYNAKDIPGKDPIAAQKAFENMMAPPTLEFKKGAQVMLIKNFDEGLVNGSLGKIQAFMTTDVHNYWKDNEEEFEEIWGDEDDAEKQRKKQEIRAAMNKKNPNPDGANDTGTHYPLVRFSLPDGTFRTMLCTPEDWKVEGNIRDEIVAHRRQVPLILAWALSIHKAQGQTLERVKVNLGRVFEKGQAYVALSRATSQAGLQVLNFNANKVMVHQKVISFYDNLVSIHTITPQDSGQADGKRMITAKDYERNFVDISDDDDGELYMYEQ
ncbi:putative mitochondrial dna helicase [Phaeomoniella chlamydospora]|uniref:ATP-dependent DNA helicase PIF1 n=1 Tax=Phaeomoniella chlamydospora TaxID=158046 RepID=A0A0G2G6N1_PHACM|nr:putative mitochondrial dna helicase [Phaeomoniella chlamydospora]